MSTAMNTIDVLGVPLTAGELRIAAICIKQSRAHRMKALASAHRRVRERGSRTRGDASTRSGVVSGPNRVAAILTRLDELDAPSLPYIIGFLVINLGHEVGADLTLDLVAEAIGLLDDLRGRVAG